MRKFLIIGTVSLAAAMSAGCVPSEQQPTTTVQLVKPQEETIEIVVVVPQAPATDRNTPDGFFDPGADEVTSNLEQSGNRDGVNQIDRSNSDRNSDKFVGTGGFLFYQIDRSNSDRNSDKFVGTGGFLALQNASVVDHDIGQKPVTKPKRTYVLRDGRLESVVDNVPTGYTEPVSLKR